MTTGWPKNWLRAEQLISGLMSSGHAQVVDAFFAGPALVDAMFLRSGEVSLAASPLEGPGWRDGPRLARQVNANVAAKGSRVGPPGPLPTSALVVGPPLS